jgi:hypothetical protein
MTEVFQRVDVEGGESGKRRREEIESGEKNR